MPSIRTLIGIGSTLTFLWGTGTIAFATPIEHRWSDAAKESVGTAFGQKSSKVWFTLAHGILTETYFPTIDRAQIGDSQILIGFPNGRFLEEKRDFSHQITHPPGVPRPILKAHGEGDWGHAEFTKEVLTDPNQNALRIRYRILDLPKGATVYFLHKPTADNDGAHDFGQVLTPAAARSHGRSQSNTFIFAWDKELQNPVYQAITANVPIRRASVGVVGETDGWQDLSRYGKMVNQISSNGPANIAVMAELEPASEFEIVVGFGFSGDEAATAIASTLRTPFPGVAAAFDNGWQNYAATLFKAAWLRGYTPLIQSELVWNGIVMKVHEDKLNPGAIIAGLSIPDLPNGRGASDGRWTGGYHLIWPRDLYKTAIGLLRLGDAATAYDSFRFMMRMEHNGRMNQNSWTSGAASWNASQMDEEAFPVLLASELVRAGIKLDEQEKAFLDRRINRVRASAGFSEQERWEEVSGYSPNTIAVMAAALSRIGDQAGATQMLSTALSKTVTHNGPYSPTPYFLRIAQNGQPDNGQSIQIGNGGPSIPENSVVDGGFLEWTRWFPKPEAYFGSLGSQLSSVLASTLRVYDDPRNGVVQYAGNMPLYKRYTFDAYGVRHQGGPWPILSMERALPDLATNPDAALRYYGVARRLWGPGDLCPEQVGADLKPMPFAATPLVWCHAEMVELLYSAAVQKKAPHGINQRNMLH